jgi:hypothetical protein
MPLVRDIRSALRRTRLLIKDNIPDSAPIFHRYFARRPGRPATSAFETGVENRR